MSSNTYRGSCHCGSVKFSAELENGLRDVYRCTCSLCRKKNALMVAVSLNKLSIESGAKNLTVYRWNAGIAKHYFCRQCGVYTHHQRRSRPDQFSLNVACLDGVKTETYTPAIVDGANIPLESQMQIRQEVDENKFIACEGDDCGYIKYRETEAVLEVLSTFVPPELRGGGRAAKLTRFALDYARNKQLKVEPICSYTQLFLKRHKGEYDDLL